MFGLREMQIEEVSVTPTLNKDGLFAVVYMRGANLLLANSIMIPEVLDAKKLNKDLVKDGELECSWPLSADQDIELFRQQCIGANIILYSRQASKSYMLGNFEVKELEKTTEVELQKGIDVRGIIEALHIYCLLQTEISSQDDTVSIIVRDKKRVARILKTFDEVLANVSLRMIIQNVDSILLRLDAAQKELFGRLVLASFKDFRARVGEKFVVDDDVKPLLELLPTFKELQPEADFVKSKMILDKLQPLIKAELLDNDWLKFSNLFAFSHSTLECQDPSQVLKGLWERSAFSRELLCVFFDGKERLYDTKITSNNFQQKKKKRTIRRFDGYRTRLNHVATACGIDINLPPFVIEKKLVMERSVNDLKPEDDDLLWHEQEFIRLDQIFTLRCNVASLLLFVGLNIQSHQLADFFLSKIWPSALTPKLLAFPQVLPINPSKKPMLYIPMESPQTSTERAVVPLLYAAIVVCDFSSLPNFLNKVYSYLFGGKQVIFVVYDDTKTKHEDNVTASVEASLREMHSIANKEGKIALDRLVVCLTRFEHDAQDGYRSSKEVLRQIEETCELAEREAEVPIEAAGGALSEKRGRAPKTPAKRGGSALESEKSNKKATRKD